MRRRRVMRQKTLSPKPIRESDDARRDEAPAPSILFESGGPVLVHAAWTGPVG